MFNGLNDKKNRQNELQHSFATSYKADKYLRRLEHIKNVLKNF